MQKNQLILYQGSSSIVDTPEIHITKYTKDFSWGFYCTNDYDQSFRWASKNKTGFVNKYKYTPNEALKILSFPSMSDKWLDFIANCRSGKTHEFDIVEGPMADDTIWNYVSDYLAGEISREAFWALAKFRYPTHQISFHSVRALACLEYIGSDDVYE